MRCVKENGATSRGRCHFLGWGRLRKEQVEVKISTEVSVLIPAEMSRRGRRERSGEVKGCPLSPGILLPAQGESHTEC